jgi:Tol biopolymer transport system component
MSSLSVSIGQILGHYRILEQIGAGGMGVVYRAHDERLDRDVALKVLPAGTLGDDIARRRFRKEALALAKLDHPNVATVHEFGSQDGVDFLVTAYIPGVTLDTKVSCGAFPQEEVISLGIQLAEGLTAAHEQGVIHRDLKPGNLRLTPDNRLKILDFGLARLIEPEGDAALTASLTHSQEVTGTVPYMAPEQLRGERTDARTDIWAAGAVLYEMATGQRPFQGKTLTGLAADIIHKLPPAPRILKPELSPELERIMQKCLQKEPLDRYQSAKELAGDLRLLQGPGRAVTSAAGAVLPTHTAADKGRRPLILSVLAFVVVALAGTAWFYFSRREELNLPPPRVVPLTSLSDQANSPAFSPDGNQVAFGRYSDVAKNSGLHIKLIGSEHLLQLTNSSSDCCPVWSPDGRFIAFSRYTKGEHAWEHAIYMLPVIGGLERKLCSRAPARGELDWSPDGKLIAFSDRNAQADSYSISLLSVDDLQIRKLTEPTTEDEDWGPAFSPEGKRLAFIRAQAGGELGDIFVMPAGGGKAERLTFDHASIPSPPAWTTDGRWIVFSSARRGQPTLWRILVSGGSPIPVPEVGVVTLHPSVSRKGQRLAYEQIIGSTSIWRLELTDAHKGGSHAQLMSSKGQSGAPQSSPDGRRIVFQSDRSGTMEIWMCNSDGSNPVQLTTFGGSPANTPRWSPDNQTIAFDSASGGHSQIFVIKAEGGLPRPITEGSFESVSPSWSRDAKWIYFASNRSGTWQVWKIPSSEGGQPLQVTKQGGFAAFESSDGKFVYYAKRSVPEIWRVPAEGGPETIVSPVLRPQAWTAWALVEHGIFFISEEPTPDSVLKFFDFATSSAKNIAVLKKHPSWLSASDDGKWVLHDQPDQLESNIMLLENFR